MDRSAVVKLCAKFERAGLAYWVDGGWGVDALIGEQTRPHSDLDLAVLLEDIPEFERLLKLDGYTRIIRDRDPEWNWFLVNSDGGAVDLHGFVLDEVGNGVLGDASDGAMYPCGALEGVGTLGGHGVRCVSAPFVLLFRNSFAPRDVDHHDVAALCSRFDLPRPTRFVLDDC